ncbi:MAG: site-specific DNA-methyltransferase [Pseudomonadota bacterium]
MRAWPEKSIKCIVTSPPYNLMARSTTMRNPRHANAFWPGAKLAGGYDGCSDNMPHGQYVEWQRDCLQAMKRLLRDDGVIFYNHKDLIRDKRLVSPDEILRDMPVRQRIIWDRCGGFNFNDDFFVPAHETIYMIAKPEFRLCPRANRLGTVWRLRQDQGTHNPHPAPFPIELAERCIASVGDGIILDPFMGSGTTAIAAIRHNRTWLGIEQSKQYSIYATQRINHETRQHMLAI